MHYEKDEDGDIWEITPRRPVSIQELQEKKSQYQEEINMGETQIERYEERRIELETNIAGIDALLVDEG